MKRDLSNAVMFCNSINFWEIRDFDLNLRIYNFCILQNWPIRINHTIEAGQVIFIASECVQVTNQNLEIKHCLSALLSKIIEEVEITYIWW